MTNSTTCACARHTPSPTYTAGKYLAFSYFYDVLPEFVRPKVPDAPSLAEIRAAALQVLPFFLFSFPFFFSLFFPTTRTTHQQACSRVS